MLCQPHDVFPDAHLSNLAVILDLDILKVNLPVDSVYSGINGRLFVFLNANLAHQTSIRVKRLLIVFFGSPDRLLFAVDHGFDFSESRLGRIIKL